MKFKIGDKVRIVGNTSSGHSKSDRIGCIEYCGWGNKYNKCLVSIDLINHWQFNNDLELVEEKLISTNHCAIPDNYEVERKSFQQDGRILWTNFFTIKDMIDNRWCIEINNKEEFDQVINKLKQFGYDNYNFLTSEYLNSCIRVIANIHQINWNKKDRYIKLGYVSIPAEIFLKKIILNITVSEEYKKEFIKKHKNKLRGENKMHKAIIENFEKTEDAVIVEKFMSKEFDDSFQTEIFIKEHKEEVLQEAKLREADNKDKMEKL